MRINGEKLPTLAVFPKMMTVPDCVVVRSNKLGSGNGEAKFYIANKEEMYSFYGDVGFSAKCFLLKSDLLAYMNAIKNEYFAPSQNYAKLTELPMLWSRRMEKIQKLDDVIFFTLQDQAQIAGARGYVNSSDAGYRLIRELALPLVSYVYVEKVGTEDSPLFYWKLFVDFETIWEKKNGPLVFNYGKALPRESKLEPAQENKDDDQIASKRKNVREGQVKYREQLLEQCRFCPFTMIADERLLIASHIKPWAASTEQERVDPYNGYMLSPLYDKLFDKGFITFTEQRRVILSEFVSPYTWRQLGLKNNTFVGTLPMDEKRIHYLEFHHTSVFKGSIEE